MLSRVSAGLCASLFLAIVAACSGTTSGGDDAGSCTPNKSTECLCIGGKTSTKVCNANGNGYGDCQCGGTGGTGGGTSSSSASASSSSAATGTGGHGGSGPDPDCFDYTTWQPTAGIHFRTDVLPILRQSCSVNGASCHGAISNSNTTQHYFGPPIPDGGMGSSSSSSASSGSGGNGGGGGSASSSSSSSSGGGASDGVTDAEIDAIFEQSVSTAATEEGSLDVIHKGSPENSFIMYKIDATQGVGVTCAKLPCVSHFSCGLAMPETGGQLAADKRNIIRSWIALGALKD